MALTTDIDVKIGYSEEKSFLNTPKNVLCFIEDSPLCKVDRGCYFIDSSEQLLSFVDQNTNPSAFNFNSAFFAQSVRPKGYWLVIGDFSGGAATLTTGNFRDFNSFKNQFVNQDQQFTGLAFNLLADDVGIAPDMLESMASFDQLAAVLSFFGDTDYQVTVSGNKLRFQTNKAGSEVVMGEMTAISGELEVKTLLLTGTLPAWNTFTESAGEGPVKITIKDSEDTTVNFNIDISQVSDWTEFFEEINNIQDENIVAEYYPNSNMGIVLLKNFDDITSIENTDEGTDFVSLLNLTKENGAIWGSKHTLDNNDPTIANTPALMQATEETGAKIVEGFDNILGTPQVFSQINEILTEKNIRSGAICLSRNLYATEANAMDIGTIVNYAEGFGANFSRGSNAPTTILSLFADDTVIAQTNGLNRIYNQPYARDIVLNYSSKHEYLDGAIAAYIAGVDYSGSDICRNTKGLVFNGISAEENITNSEAETFKEKRINFYSVLENGIQMYREGQTLSRGDAGYIDISMGINAITKDMIDALIRLIQMGTLKMNSEGGTRIYSALATVCEKYVSGGFLSATTQMVTDENGPHEVAVPPYKIYVAKSFTHEQITSRNYPDTKVELASSIFVNTITVNLNSAYQA